MVKAGFLEEVAFALGLAGRMFSLAAKDASLSDGPRDRKHLGSWVLRSDQIQKLEMFVKGP